MDLLIVLIILLLLFGGGGGSYWGMGAGWGIGPIGLIVVAIVVAYLLYGYRGPTRPSAVARPRSPAARPRWFARRYDTVPGRSTDPPL